MYADAELTADLTIRAVGDYEYVDELRFYLGALEITDELTQAKREELAQALEETVH